MDTRLTFENFSIRRVFLACLISSLSLGALLAIIVFLAGNFGKTESDILLTTLAIGGYSLSGLCSSTLFDRNRYTAFALFGITVAIVGFILTVGGIWDIIEFEKIWKAVITFTILSFSTAHASLLLLTRSENNFINSIVSVTLLFIAVVAGMLIKLIIAGSDLFMVDEFYYRLLGAFAVLDVLGTILVPILKRIKS